MNKVNFFSSLALEKIIVNRKMSTDGNKINWFKIQKIIYNRHEPFMLHIKEYSPADAPVISLSLGKRGNESIFHEIELNLLYEDGRAITKQKYDDLQSLLQYIPSEYHEFYQTLKFTDKTRKDFELASRQSSDDEEYENE